MEKSGTNGDGRYFRMSYYVEGARVIATIDHAVKDEVIYSVEGGVNADEFYGAAWFTDLDSAKKFVESVTWKL